MRVLLSTTSGAGHFRPLLPVARALADADHEVACAAADDAGAMVEREGLRWLSLGSADDGAERGAVFGQVPGLPPTEAEKLIGREIFGRLNTTFALPGALAAVDSFAPDVVVHDPTEMSVRMAAELAGIRTVAVNPLLELPAFLMQAIAGGIEHLRAELGLPPDHDGAALLATESISWVPGSFDTPGTTGVRRFRDPSAPTPQPLADREVVYVTLGSEAAQLPFFASVIRPCVAGALDAGLPVVVSTGKPVDPDVLAGLSGDLTVETWVDQDELLRRTRVVVCHTGSGTTLGALQAGVPIVAVPLFADQPYNAERVLATGCGVRLDAGPALQADVKDAVQDLASSDAAGSLAMAAQVAALPPITAAVDWLAAG